LKQRTLLSSWADVINFCRTSMAFADKEQFRILYSDAVPERIASLF
jgi:DNA repair protein RadC